MNILLWVIQIVLAMWSITGALYMMSNYQSLAQQWALSALPTFAWMIIGVLQILFAVGLILPGVLRKFSKLTSTSAAGLAILSLLGTVLYISYTGFPGILWGLIPAVLAAFVAYKRKIHLSL